MVSASKNKSKQYSLPYASVIFLILSNNKIWHLEGNEKKISKEITLTTFHKMGIKLEQRRVQAVRVGKKRKRTEEETIGTSTAASATSGNMSWSSIPFELRREGFTVHPRQLGKLESMIKKDFSYAIAYMNQRIDLLEVRQNKMGKKLKKFDKKLDQLLQLVLQSRS